MPELFLLLAFMVATLVLLAGLMVIFRGWMRQKDMLVGEPTVGAAKAHAAHGHHHH